MPAPVNTGDVWIVQQAVASNACLDTDFAICPITAPDFGVDEYFLHGGVNHAGKDTVYVMGGEDSDGSKIQGANGDRERFKLMEMDFAGNQLGLLHDYTDQIVPPHFFRITAHAQGDARLFQGISIEQDEFGYPTPPRYFYNYRDNPIGSGLYYVLRDTEASTPTNNTVASGPGIVKGNEFFLPAGGIVDSDFHVCRYPIPVGGPADLTVWTGRYMDPDLVATDSLLRDIGASSVLIRSDDGRMFVFRWKGGADPDDRKLVEFDENLNVLDSWQFTEGDVRSSFGGALSLHPIANNRIAFAHGRTNINAMLLYELTPSAAPTIVHEWDSGDLNSIWHLVASWQGVPGSDGIAWAQMKFLPTGPHRTAFINFKGTPDYVP